MKKYSQKSWFTSDNRKTFATYNAIKSSDETSEPFRIKQAVCDPVNLPLTFYNLLKKSNGEIKGPFQLDLNPTSKCSDNCVFCFNKKDRHSKVEADSKKIIETIDYLCEHTSLQHIKSSGFGDPLFYKDLWKIFSFAKSKGLHTS